MKNTIILLAALFSLSFSLQATTLSCAHESTCLLLKELNQKNLFKIEPLLQKVGDPHHFQPTQKEIKKLISAEKLILPPVEMWPWMKTLIHKRTKASTLILTSEQLPLDGNPEVLAHFWLHPKLICFQKKWLIHQLQSLWSLKIEEMTCKQEDQIFNQMQKLTEKLKETRIVITHDALTPFFESLSKSILAMRSSHHSDTFSPRQMKELDNYLNKTSSKPILWILEDQVTIPLKISGKIRKRDRILKMKTSPDDNDSLYSLLNQLIKNLEN